jgi:tetratricopeptide (TPR) repeat protein
LESVVTRLAGEASPGQLARAYLGIAELELGKGDVEAARKALASATAKRREGDTMLSEELAELYARAYLLDEAEREATRAMAGSPRLAPRLVMADVALKRGRPAKALAMLSETGSTRPDALVLSGLAKLALGKKEAAKIDAEAALKLQPDLIPARVLLARTLLADGKMQLAENELNKMERSSVKSAEVAAALGMLFAAKKSVDTARRWFGEALKRDPLQFDARLQLAQVLRDSGRLDEAQAELKRLLAINSAHAEVRRELGQLALDRGDAVSARDEFDALLDKDPDVDMLLQAARAHLLLGDGAGAEERVLRAQKLGVTGAKADEAALITARSLLVRHRADEALEIMRPLVQKAQRADMWAAYIAALCETQQFDRAQELARAIAPKLRVEVELLVELARLDEEQGKNTLAEAKAREALNRLKGPLAARSLKAEAEWILGRALYDQGAFKPAEQALKQAVELDPAFARAHYHLGMVEEELKHRDVAVAEFEKATSNDPQFPDAWYDLGRVLAEQKDPKAKAAFQSYLELAPKGNFATEAKRSLKELDE